MRKQSQNINKWEKVIIHNCSDAQSETPSFMKGKCLMSICRGRTTLTGDWLTVPHPETALEESFTDMISCGQSC